MMTLPQTFTIGGAGDGYFTTFERGKNYIIWMIIGTMCMVISDKRVSVPKISNNNLIEYFVPLVVSSTDFSPFGAELIGRTYSPESIAYGFNNKRKDNEIYGEGKCL